MTPYGDCVYCGGRSSSGPERIDYRYHGQLFILERVPTGVCTQCGEKYFTAEVAKTDGSRCLARRPEPADGCGAGGGNGLKHPPRMPFDGPRTRSENVRR